MYIWNFILNSQFFYILQSFPVSSIASLPLVITKDYWEVNAWKKENRINRTDKNAQNCSDFLKKRITDQAWSIAFIISQ